MGYTDEEIQTAVQRAVITTIRRNVDSLGVRQIEQTFNDVQEAALGIFLLYQVAPFYVISLGTQRLLEELATQVTNVLNLQQALLDSGRKVIPITNIAPLNNARAALFELQGAVAARSSAFASIAGTPAFQRFSNNVDNFLNENGHNIKQGGDIVQTPQEAKNTIISLLSEILTAQQDLIEKATFLRDALKDYSALNLPSVAAQGAVSRVRQTVSSLVATLDPLSPQDRLEKLRLGVLDLLTSRAVLKEVGTFKEPGSIFAVSGAATAFADTTHPAVPAVVRADIFAPYNITGFPPLDVTLDGGPLQTVNLQDSIYAALSGGTFEPFQFNTATQAILTGTVAETFNINAGNNSLIFYVFDTVSNQTAVIVVSLTTGGAQTAAQVATDINAAILAAHLDAQYESLAGGAGNTHVVIRSKTGVTGNKVRISIAPGTANTVLGLAAGIVGVGTDDNRHFIVDVNGVPSAMNFAAGSTSAVSAATQINANLGPNIFASAQGAFGFQFINIQYVGPGTFTATLKFPSANNPAADVLGLLKDAGVPSRASTARSVAKNLNLLVPNLNASAEVVPMTGGANVLMRSEPSDPSLVVVYKSRGTGIVTPGLGNTLTLSVTGADFIAAGVQPGDILVFRDGVNLFTKWTITAVTTTTVDATGIAPAVGGSATFEIGPNLPIFPGFVVEVKTGVQLGIYTIQSIGPTSLAVPFELELDNLLPGFQSAILGPQFFSGNVGQERLVVASKSTAPNSAITLANTAAALFFGAGSATAVGTTPWVQLPVAVPGLAPEDILENYLSVYNVPTAAYPIQTVEGTVIGIQPAAVDLGTTFNLATGGTVPFALLRSAAFQRYTDMSNRLAAWLELPQNKNPFVIELRRLINIVLFESFPAPDQVNAAMAQVQALLDMLRQLNSPQPTKSLEFALVNYTVPVLDQVDSLIRTYTEKGSQRAIDLLVQGQFSVFFGLDVHEVSYAGAMLSQMRQVARLDLPVRKIDREMSRTSPVQSSSTSPDFEYDSSNIEQVPPTDVPTEFERIPPTRG